MFGYRTGETPVVHVHVKKPKPFKWLRKLFRRLKFRHARFEDGKYMRGQKDIEKWHEDDPLTKADYPDYRWQAVNKPRTAKQAKRSSKQKLSSSPAQSDSEHDQNDISVVRNRKKTSKNKMRGGKCDQTDNPQGNSLDVDAIEKVLENDPNYKYGPDKHHVHSPLFTRFTKLMRNKREAINETASKTIKTARKLRASISGYSSLEAELSPQNSPTKKPLIVQVEINSPDKIDSRNYTDWLAIEEQKSIEMNRNPFHPIFGQGLNDINLLHYPKPIYHDIVNKTETPPNFDFERTPSQHEHDNDKNHMLILEKKHAKKKPKSRKNRKKRVRRKGKYTELEAAPSIESFVELETNETEVFTLTPKKRGVKNKKEKVKSKQKKKKKERNASDNLRQVFIAVRNIPDAPVFHPRKYRGYTRFYEEES